MILLYYIIVMNTLIRGSSYKIIGRLRCADHKIMNITKDPSYKLEFNSGFDTRYPQEYVSQEYLEHFHKRMRTLDHIQILQSDTYPAVVKQELAKQVLYNHDEPCLVMYLRGGGLMSGSDFDDDDFNKN